MTVPWTWAWGPPGSLASTAHFGDNPVFDVVRVVVVVCGCFLVWMVARVLVEQRRRREKMPEGQTIRFWALGLAAISIAVTEAYVVGTTATPRLFLNAAVITLGIWGTGSKRRRQKTEPLA